MPSALKQYPPAMLLRGIFVYYIVQLLTVIALMMEVIQVSMALIITLHF